MGDEGLPNRIADGDTRVQAGIRVLEDDLQLAAIAIHVALPQTGQLDVAVVHLASAGFEQAQDEPSRGRLATAALPHQPECFPWYHFETHAIDRFNFSYQTRMYNSFDDREICAETLDRRDPHRFHHANPPLH